MEVADGVARHVDWLAYVVAVAEADHAAVERHRGGEDLEHRAHLVDAEAGAVEARLVSGCGRALGIEGRQRHHCQELASARVHHDASGADGTELLRSEEHTSELQSLLRNS